MELKEGAMRPHRLVVAISFFLLLAASCGGDGTEEATPTPTCTTVTPGPDGSLTPTPTPCLVGATEAPPTPEPTDEPVGEVWEGTTSSIVTADGPGGPCGNPVRIQGTVQLLVAGDGSVTGTYDLTGCGVSQPHAEWTGTVTDAGFLFPQLVVFTNGSLIPKVSPTHAEATLTNMQGPVVTWVTTWDLTCTSCEE